MKILVILRKARTFVVRKLFPNCRLFIRRMC